MTSLSADAQHRVVIRTRYSASNGRLHEAGCACGWTSRLPGRRLPRAFRSKGAARTVAFADHISTMLRPTHPGTIAPMERVMS